MRTTSELGRRIAAAQREYFRYTGVSAEVERRGVGSSHPELPWTQRNPSPIDPGGFQQPGVTADKENMLTLTASDARARFYWVLDQVERGERIGITRRGKLIATIEPIPESDLPAGEVHNP